MVGVDKRTFKDKEKSSGVFEIEGEIERERDSKGGKKSGGGDDQPTEEGRGWRLGCASKRVTGEKRTVECRKERGLGVR